MLAFNPFTGTLDYTLSSPATVSEGGTGLSTIASGSILAANALDTLSAITSTSGLKALQNNAGTIGWNASTGTGNSVFATSPTFVTDLTTPLIYGGSGASGTLSLQSTSNATRGTVDLLDTVRAVTAAQAVGAANGILIDTATGGVTLTTGSVIVLRFASTVTLGGNSAVTLAALFNAACTIQDDGTGRTGGPSLLFAAQPTCKATVASGLTLNDFSGIPAVAGFYYAPTFNRTGAGTGTVATAAALHVSNLANVGTGWTVTSYVGLLIDKPTVTGTVTNFYGVKGNGAAATNYWFLYETGGMQSSHKGNLRLGSNTAPNTVLDVTGVIRTDQTIANGTVATVLGSVGPVGANTTVQEWFKININGTTRFVPCF